MSPGTKTPGTRIESERRACSFQLLRYVPDPVRNEYVHIGVILRETASSDEPGGADGQAGAQGAGGTGGPGRIEVRFTRDWRRVRCLDPEADTALLEAMESELRQRLTLQPESEPGGRLMRLLEESLSLGVQMTEAKAYLAESLPAGVEELMRLYVDPPPRERMPRLSGRAAIQARMRSEFEHAGVWDLLRKRIAASEYTRPGDPLHLDLGYRPLDSGPNGPGSSNGPVRMFHAVSLDPGVGAGIEMAKVLAFSAAGLRAGVERVENAELELTAVIEPAAQFGLSGLGAGEDEPERLAVYRFGVETMEEHRIRVLTTADLGRVAEAARRELRA